MQTLRLYADIMSTFHNQFFCFKVSNYDAAVVLYLKFKSPRWVKIRAAYWSDSNSSGSRLDLLLKSSEQELRELYKITPLDSDNFIEEMMKKQKDKRSFGIELDWIEKQKNR